MKPLVSLGSCSSAPLSRKDFSSAHNSTVDVLKSMMSIAMAIPHELEYDYPLMCTKVIFSGCFYPHRFHIQNPTVIIMIFHIWHLFDETIHHFTTLRTDFAV